MQTEHAPVALIGSGAVATSLGHALRHAGYPVGAVISASFNSARELAIRLEARVASAAFSDLPAGLKAVFVCVPDSAIAEVDRALASRDLDWPGCLVAHTSGAVAASALSAVKSKGAETLSFHPIQSFPSNGGSSFSVKPLKGVYIGLEGEDRAIEAGAAFANAIGSIPVRIPTDLKHRYHLAAAVASNLLVAVVAMANEILAPDENRLDAGAEMFLPLIEGTIENLKTKSPERALTGPIVRGDVRTVSKHLEVLHSELPHLLPAYTSLSAEAVRAAVRGGHISSEIAGDILDVLLYAIADAKQ